MTKTEENITENKQTQIIPIDSFLGKQDELWDQYEKARVAHPKPIKAKNARKNVNMQTHRPGSKPDCEHCLKIIDSVKAINSHDIMHLGMTRVEMMNTRNVVQFMRKVILMMKEGGELSKTEKEGGEL